MIDAAIRSTGGKYRAGTLRLLFYRAPVFDFDVFFSSNRYVIGMMRPRVL